MAKKILWKGEKLILVKRLFHENGNLSVFLLDETKFPQIKLSLNSSKISLNYNEILVNDIGKNKGIKDVLIKAGYLLPTGKWTDYKSNLVEICKIL